MHTSKTSLQNRWIIVAAMGFLALGVAGCENRTIAVDREKFINTRADPKGYPVSIDIVSVYPSDLKDAANKDLMPTGPGITADLWFARKPTRESMSRKDDVQNFRLGEEQIHSYTDEDNKTIYGRRKGGKIIGTDASSGNIVISRSQGLPVRDIFSSEAAIYVFAKFTDKNGKVLPSRPAVFWRVGDFKEELAVRIKGESIERTTKRSTGKPLAWEEGEQVERERRGEK